MEWIEAIETSLSYVVAIAQLCLESTSVLCVILGLLRSLRLAVRLVRQHQTSGIFPFNYIRLRFGMWLALALEFQLGADILGTTLNPSVEELIKLAVIAIIRSFLNYFLGKELEKELDIDNRREKLEEEVRY